MKKGKSITISTRKIERNRLRKEAKNAKASKYVSNMFDDQQIKKYGLEERVKNQAKGCRKRKNWRQNIALAMDTLKVGG